MLDDAHVDNMTDGDHLLHHVLRILKPGGGKKAEIVDGHIGGREIAVGITCFVACVFLYFYLTYLETFKVVIANADDYERAAELHRKMEQEMPSFAEARAAIANHSREGQDHVAKYVARNLVPELKHKLLAWRSSAKQAVPELSARLVHLERDREEEMQIKGLQPRPPMSRLQLSFSALVVAVGSMQLSIVLPSLWTQVQQVAGETTLSPTRLLLLTFVLHAVSALVAKQASTVLAGRIGFGPLLNVLANLGAIGGVGYAIAPSRDLVGSAGPFVLLASLTCACSCRPNPSSIPTQPVRGLRCP
uniref:Uncharacterized protein n=1 Tax=Haptolina brevifila TaxID=156173 RepID=A0A7S2C1N6_9EUKA|mmetsp:Transcript_19285/g.39424  ORF Transcript_19285/g.39424 Transcript_19285/m.39424 type:complete len:304 (+) Transcript_19285:153-1064(+)